MRVGWYIHHQGRGHLQRFQAVRPHLDDVTALSSVEAPAGLREGEWLTLAMDAPISEAQAVERTAGGMLHWAPLGPGGYRERMTSIADWVDQERPAAIVVDVSVEVALFARLLGVPTVWVAQRGRRDDLPHQLAFRSAAAIVAPWTADTEIPDAEHGLPAARVRHVGALSRFDGRSPAPLPTTRRVLLLLGFGGQDVAAEDIAAAAAQTPEWQWDVLGQPQRVWPPNVRAHPPDADVWALLAAARVIVTAASTNAIAEVAAARRPAVLLPQTRPFGEQHEQARALVEAGLAEAFGAWPEPAHWPGILERAGRRDPSGWARLHDGHGAQRLAAVIREVACASA